MGAELLPLFIREPRVHLKELQKAMAEKTDDNGIFSLFFFPHGLAELERKHTPFPGRETL